MSKPTASSLVSWRRWLPQAVISDLSNFIKISTYLHGVRSLVWGCVVVVPIIVVLSYGLTWLVYHVTNEIFLRQNVRILLIYCIIYFVVLLLLQGAKLIQSVMFSHLIKKSTFQLKDRSIKLILQQKPAFHDHNTSGHLVARTTDEFDSIAADMRQGVLDIVAEIAGILGGVLALFSVHRTLGVVTFVSLPLTCYFIYRISKIIRFRTYRLHQSSSAFNSFVQESLYQTKLIKLFNSHQYISENYADMNKKVHHEARQNFGYDCCLAITLDTLSPLAVGCGFYFLVANLWEVKDADPGAMIAFVKVMGQIFNPLQSLGHTMSTLQRFFSGLERVLEILSLKHYIEGDVVLPQSALIKPGPVVAIHDLSFAYHRIHALDAPLDSTMNPEPAAWALKSINLRIPPYTSCALVGATGAGKSTLVKVLMKLYDGYSGSIRLAGHELRTLSLASVQANIALVSQDLTFFSGSVEFNISLGRSGVSRAHIIHQAKIMGVHDVIMGWPENYEHTVLEGGSNLSQGERQILALLRALCLDAKILIFDEPTSALDPRMEAKIHHIIQQIKPAKTLIIIAHKLSTIQNCDNIVVFHQGEVVEQGTHDDLLDQQGFYRSLIEAHQSAGTMA